MIRRCRKNTDKVVKATVTVGGGGVVAGRTCVMQRHRSSQPLDLYMTQCSLLNDSTTSTENVTFYIQCFLRTQPALTRRSRVFCLHDLLLCFV